jgi:hypothetical protein
VLDPNEDRTGGNKKQETKSDSCAANAQTAPTAQTSKITPAEPSCPARMPVALMPAPIMFEITRSARDAQPAEQGGGF